MARVHAVPGKAKTDPWVAPRATRRFPSLVPTLVGGRPPEQSPTTPGNTAPRTGLHHSFAALPVQAVFEPAVATVRTSLRRTNSSGEIQTGMFSESAKKLKAGDPLEANLTDSKDNDTWVKGKVGGAEGYVERQNIYLVGQVQTLGTMGAEPEAESTTLDCTKEAVEGTLGKPAESAASIVSASGTKGPGGKVEVPGGSTKDALESVGALSGTAAGILGMVASAKQISKQKGAWENFQNGYGFVESAASAVASSNKLVDAMAKAVGLEKGLGESTIVSKYTSAVSSGLTSVKNAALGVIGLYKLYKSQSSEKPKDALVTLKQLTAAAQGAASVAKSAYEIIGKGIPPALGSTIPGLSIALSAINLIIRLADAIGAGSTKKGMATEADRLRGELANLFGVVAPDPDTDSELFDKDRRGKFPVYSTYFRVKKKVRTAVRTAKDLARERLQKLDPTALLNPRDPSKVRQVARRAYRAVKSLIAAAGLPSPIKEKLLERIEGAQDPSKRANYDIQQYTDETVDRLASVDENIDSYEFADKMAEINLKRQTGGWTDVGLELLSIAGEIVTLVTGPTGVGAIVGQALKASTVAYKGALGGAQFIQKIYRDREASGAKSTDTKHKEYVGHSRFLFSQLAKLDAQKPSVQNDIKRVNDQLDATGVNVGLFLATADAASRVQMVVKAMKER